MSLRYSPKKKTLNFIQNSSVICFIKFGHPLNVSPLCEKGCSWVDDWLIRVDKPKSAMKNCWFVSLNQSFLFRRGIECVNFCFGQHLFLFVSAQHVKHQYQWNNCDNRNDNQLHKYSNIVASDEVYCRCHFWTSIKIELYGINIFDIRVTDKNSLSQTAAPLNSFRLHLLLFVFVAFSFCYLYSFNLWLQFPFQYNAFVYAKQTQPNESTWTW